MATLAITDSQKTLILDAFRTYVELALAEGTDAPSFPGAVPPMAIYLTQLSVSDRAAIKDTWCQIVAALIKALGVDAPIGGLDASISYIKGDGISVGTLTFTNGILTASV